jgi:hypothetical protein
MNFTRTRKKWGQQGKNRAQGKMVPKNGARPHFLLLYPQVENVLFLTKWGLAPFISNQL